MSNSYQHLDAADSDFGCASNRWLTQQRQTRRSGAARRPSMGAQLEKDGVIEGYAIRVNQERSALFLFLSAYSYQP